MPHAFVSYLREDADTVDRLADALREHGIEVWLDRTHLVVGDRWPHVVKTAIREGKFFIACFSPAYALRARTHMNEELTTAIEELRLRPRERRWFLPVAIDSGAIPALDLGAGETLESLHHVDLSEDWDAAVRQLVHAITHDQRRGAARNAARAEPSAGGVPDSPPAPPRRLRSAMLVAVTAAVVLTGAILSWHTLGQTPSQPPPCNPHAARVTAPSAADTTFDIAVDVVCPPPRGRVFWLFIRGDNVGDHGTTNYYPNLRLRSDAGRQITQNYVKPSDPDGERFYLVVSVPESVSRTLTGTREFVDRLPPSGEIVSASVRTVISHPSQPR
jgi:hypothetical protein